MSDIFPHTYEHHPTGPVGDDLLRRRRAMAPVEPTVVVDRGTLFVGAAANDYRIEVGGRGLFLALAPPDVTVGGVSVHDLSTSSDGTSMTGRLPSLPADARLVIDYGFARSEFTLTRRTSWWHRLRPAVLGIWSTIDRVMRRWLDRSPA